MTRYLEKSTPIKYIIAEKWIDEYTTYLNGDKQPPGAIDNQNMDEKVLRKRDNNKTLYAVNEKIWKFLMKLYGGGPEISQVNPRANYSSTDSDKLSDARTIDTTTRSDAMDSTHSSFGFDTSIVKSGPSSIAVSEPIGMVNEMFFCYMNSSMQCVLGIDDLVQYTSQERYKKDLVSKNPKFWTSFSEIIYYNNKKSNDFTPKLLRKISQKLFEPSEQHDAHEFLRYFLSGMQDELTAITKEKKEVEFKDADYAWEYYLKLNPSIIDKLFAGQLVSKVCCCKCGNVSTSYDPFHDLALPIGENTKNLDDCIAAFLKDEEIKDCYTCEKCKDNQKSIKKLSINKFPKIFVFHLKRFQTYPVRKKLRDPIMFPTGTMKMKK